ncbi:hypothetical protein Tco_0922048 [Tanacetum coccineum]|uniref:Uncharacterized protein n=1 Tax=Tanacetum coccineum TaxID=301880 RepID=A0ABQ5D494_9ASTR
MMEGSKNVIDDSLPPRNDELNILGTRLEPRSDKESPEVEITNDKVVEITNVVIPVNVNEEEEEITDEVYKLKQREKGKLVEESRSTPFPTPIRSPRIHTNLVSSDTEKLQELTAFDNSCDHLQEVMVESLPTMVDTHIKEQVKKQVPEQVRDQVPVYVAEGLILERQKTKEEMERMIAKAILQERGNIQAKISSQIQNAIDNHIPSQVDASVRSYMSGHILHVHPVQSQTTSVPEQQYQLYNKLHVELLPFAQEIRTILMMMFILRGRIVQSDRRHMSNQEQVDDYDFWTDSYASDDDEIPINQVSQDIMEEVSLTIDEAKLKKMADEMLRQRCTSGDEHQYHIDQDRIFLKVKLFGKVRKDILVSLLHERPHL